jgi:hypothetical protein
VSTRPTSCTNTSSRTALGGSRRSPTVYRHAGLDEAFSIKASIA